MLNNNNMGKWNANKDNIYQEMLGGLNYGMFRRRCFSTTRCILVPDTAM